MKRLVAALFCIIISFKVYSQPLSKTKVMILGTPHLAQVKDFKSSYLQSIIVMLKSENFDAIAIESMPSQLLLDIKSRPQSHWQDLYNHFKERFEFGKQSQAYTGLTEEAAKKIIESLNQKQSISESDRVAYINAYLSSYDIWSACLHFRQVIDKSKLRKEVTDLLSKYVDSINEINLIAVELASGSEVRQLHYIDNLQDETILLSEFPSFLEDYQSNSESIQKLMNTDFYKNVSIEESNAVKKSDLFELYKFYNSDEYTKGDFNAQWGLWFKTNFRSKSDRSRYSLWEMRNLSIAANVLRVVASNPEKKILVIIGASHKNFIEKYLRQIPDIELIEF